MTFPDPQRREHAKHRRDQATELSTDVPHPKQVVPRDERSPFIFSFRKGLKHKVNGMLEDVSDFTEFKDGAQSSDRSLFDGVPLNRDPSIAFPGPPAPPHVGLFREWESPTSGFAYVLMGPDPLALAMPEAPPAGSAELAAEMAEVYQMALFRDFPVAAFMDASLCAALRQLNGRRPPTDKRQLIASHNKDVAAAAERLSRMRWFSGETDRRDVATGEEKHRRRFGTEQTASNMFRGIGEDPWPTPFISQFMIMGTGGSARDLAQRATGLIAYGNQRVDQKIAVATPKQDYMTAWAHYLNVQNAFQTRGALFPDKKHSEFGIFDAGGNFIEGKHYRPLNRLRELATYVHDDQLYQAYLNAALIMLNERYAFDPGIPYHGGSDAPAPNQEPFALFGGPHLLTLVTEVSSRALKAVRGQKFSVHRRARPEALAALFHTIYTEYTPHRDTVVGAEQYPLGDGSQEAAARKTLGGTLATYTFPVGMGSEPVLEEVLTDVRLHNEGQNSRFGGAGESTWLLPMAFPEGSPMHPAYGAGHATVAGACVTLLKAFFNMRDPSDTAKPAYVVKPGEKGLVPDPGDDENDISVGLMTVEVEKGLTLEGELNKLMWNISNGRNVAGVHYNTDYIESVVLGEDITIGILREQMVAYDKSENVSMTVPLVAKRKIPAVLRNGGTIGEMEEVEAILIDRFGHLHKAPPTPRH